MSDGWLAFISRIERQHRAGRVDHAALWADFQAQIKDSRLSSLLQFAPGYAERLPPDKRSGFALMIAKLVANVDWPPNWEPGRRRLVNAMESLLLTINPQSPDSFPALLELQETEEQHVVGYAVLQTALNLLRVPCKIDELRFVARLCNVGNTACIRAYQRVLPQRMRQPVSGPLLDARTRYVIAFEHYAMAARDLNSLVQTVLFEGLDARLEPVGG